MGFSANQTVIANQTQNNTTSSNDFTKDELAMLLGILKEVTLKGHQVEVFYNLIMKIQNQYIDKNK